MVQGEQDFAPSSSRPSSRFGRPPDDLSSERDKQPQAQNEAWTQGHPSCGLFRTHPRAAVQVCHWARSCRCFWPDLGPQPGRTKQSCQFCCRHYSPYCCQLLCELCCQIYCQLGFFAQLCRIHWPAKAPKGDSTPRQWWQVYADCQTANFFAGAHHPAPPWTQHPSRSSASVFREWHSGHGPRSPPRCSTHSGPQQCGHRQPGSRFLLVRSVLPELHLDFSADPRPGSLPDVHPSPSPVGHRSYFPDAHPAQGRARARSTASYPRIVPLHIHGTGAGGVCSPGGRCHAAGQKAQHLCRG